MVWRQRTDSQAERYSWCREGSRMISAVRTLAVNHSGCGGPIPMGRGDGEGQKVNGKTCMIRRNLFLAFSSSSHGSCIMVNIQTLSHHRLLTGNIRFLCARSLGYDGRNQTTNHLRQQQVWRAGSKQGKYA